MCEAPRVTIIYQADEDGWIVASVPEVRGVHSQGRTRAEAHANVMEVLRAVVELRSAGEVAGLMAGATSRAAGLPPHVAECAARRLAAAARSPVRVVLFGSYERGDAGPDSDIDFLVIERDVLDRHAEMVRLERAVRWLGVPVDVVVMSEAYAAEWESVTNTLVHAALREGRELARSDRRAVRRMKAG